MTISANNPDEQRLIDRVYRAGQGHVFKYWNELNEPYRRNLLAQLREMDFDLLVKLQKKFIEGPESISATAKLEPADFISLAKTPQEHQAAHQTKSIGERTLSQGRVAAFLVAGGQGTRLGYSGAKGKFAVSPIKEKSLFQLHAEKILATAKRYGVIIPWYVMTSETNHQETVEFFEAHNYFALNPKDVMFFRQEMIPALNPDGHLILDAKDHIFTNPNGHGGSLSALKKSGALDDMRERGIDLIFYFQVDNVLVKMCDPLFLGHHVQEGAEMSAKVVAKTDPNEKVGVLGRINGRLGVIEYSDLSDEEKMARNPDGTLKFSAGSIAIHVLNVDFVEKENEGGLRLPWHVAHKKIPYIDESGSLIEPEKPNGYKFETFVFDALSDAERTVILEVARDEEFSPVKNAEGVDSPQTACRDMINLYGRWLEKAGIPIPYDSQNNVKGEIEISSLFALDEEELAEKIDRTLKFEGRLYLD